MAGESPDDYKADHWGELKALHNELVDLVFAIQPLAGSGVLRNDSKMGRLLSVPPAGAGETLRTPFQLIDSSEASTNKIRVVYGYVRDVINGVNWTPSGMSAGDDPEYVLSFVGSDGTVYLNITIDLDADTGLGTITALDIDTTGGTDNDTHTHVALGTYSTDADGGFHVTDAAGIGFQGYMYVNAHFTWVL